MGVSAVSHQGRDGARTSAAGMVGSEQVGKQQLHLLAWDGDPRSLSRAPVAGQEESPGLKRAGGATAFNRNHARILEL